MSHAVAPLFVGVGLCMPSEAMTQRSMPLLANVQVHVRRHRSSRSRYQNSNRTLQGSRCTLTLAINRAASHLKRHNWVCRRGSTGQERGRDATSLGPGPQSAEVSASLRAQCLIIVIAERFKSHPGCKRGSWPRRCRGCLARQSNCQLIELRHCLHENKHLAAVLKAKGL